jgi:hypothetical protein
MSRRLQKLGAGHVRLELTSQSIPCPTVTLRRQAVPAAPSVPPQLLQERFSDPGAGFQLPLC